MSSGHAVVDGSNIATEGRTEPSLAQLREAVEAFRAEYHFENVIVIVDASFEHRVSKRERTAARAAIDANEMITPPAGVIGRGDTFILQVADRADAVVLSNDSFQEFHGTYDWLFDEGRLIGGKPIPGVGWVYVPRAPVRGPVSRRARAKKPDDKKPATKKPDTKKPDAKKPETTKPETKKSEPSQSGAEKRATKSTARKATKKATRTTPESAAISTSEPESEARKPSRRRRGRGRSGAAAESATGTPTSADPASTGRVTDTDVPGANSPEVFAAFRQAHPEGSTVTATVESFSSHGAYAHAGDVALYLPLRLLADPAPRRARDLVSVGETRTFVVHRFDEDRLGIDAGIVVFAAASGQTGASARSSSSQLKGATTVAAKKAAKKATKKAPAKKAAKKAPAKKAAPKKAAKKAPAKKAAPKKAAKRARR